MMFGGGKAPPSPPGGQIGDEEVRKVWDMQVQRLQRDAVLMSSNARQSVMQRQCVNCGAARLNLGNCEYCGST